MSAWASQASKEVAVVLMTAAPCQGRGGQRHHQYKAPRGELDEKCSANRLVLVVGSSGWPGPRPGGGGLGGTCPPGTASGTWPGRARSRAVPCRIPPSS